MTVGLWAGHLGPSEIRCARDTDAHSTHWQNLGSGAGASPSSAWLGFYSRLCAGRLQLKVECSGRTWKSLGVLNVWGFQELEEAREKGKTRWTGGEQNRVKSMPSIQSQCQETHLACHRRPRKSARVLAPRVPAHT